MEFKNLSLARDLLYLSAGLLGIAVRYGIVLLRQDASVRRNRLITLMLCISSLSVIFFTVSVICSGGAILFSPALLVSAVLAIPLIALAFQFPRAVGFPLILLSGIGVVLLTMTFLRYPRIDPQGTPLAFIHINENRPTLRFNYPVNPGKKSLALGSDTARESLEFFTVLIRLDERIPLAGGESRGLITEIRTPSKEDYYTHPFLTTGPAHYGVSLQNCQGDLDTASLMPGSDYVVLFNGREIDFQTSWRYFERQITLKD
jgi:hypothetical protein